MAASFETFDDLEFELVLKNEFLSEAGEVMDEIEPCILAYEKNPKDVLELSHVVRLIQAFKESAISAGFDGLASFTSKIEVLLKAIRAGEISPSESTFEVLLMANDALREYFLRLSTDLLATHDTAHIEGLIQKALGITPTNRADHEVADQLDETFKSDMKNLYTPIKKSERVKIMVVDDEPYLREVISLILIDEGFDVVEAENGRDALDLVLADPEIKLLLTDQSMPIMKGEELVQKLRENGIKIPVIVITGVADHTAAVKFIRSGVYLYLTKPIDSDDLLLAVRNALRAGELSDTLTKALGLTFRNYLRLRRVDPESRHPMTQMKLECDMAEDLKVMGELIAKVLKKE